MSESQQNPPAMTVREKIRTWKPKDSDYIPVRDRAVFQYRVINRPVLRAISVCWPWPFREYPGLARMARWLLGDDLPISSVRRYLRAERFPSSRALIAAGRLRAKARELQAMAEQLESYAAAAPPKGHVAKSPKRDTIPPPPAGE